MVNGIDKFKEFFAKYKEQYVLIGGAACDILLEDSEGSFRATKDLDVVLIVEALTPEFGRAFWKFIEEGEYRNKCKSSGNPQFYRFDKPEAVGYPFMIELFSKKAFELEAPNSILTPLHFSNEISSLSAILLNEDYYQMLLEGRTEINNLIVLAPSYIIPFKAKAWLDLNDKKISGIHVDEKDIRKHKNDIVRLVTILAGNETILLPPNVHNDMQQFIAMYEVEPSNLKSLHITGVSNRQIIEQLKKIYH